MCNRNRYSSFFSAVRIGAIFLTVILAACSSGHRPKPSHSPADPHKSPETVSVQSPDSAFPSGPCTIQDQKFNQAEKLLGEKQYDAAMVLASQIAEYPCTPGHHIRALELIGDTYKADQKPMDAFYFFVRAAERAEAHEDASRNIAKAVTSVDHMPAGNIIEFCEKNAPPRIQQELIFNAATAKANAGNPRDARILYQAFAERYPHAAYTPTAKSILEELDSRQPLPIIGVLLPLTGYYKAGGQRALNAINYYRQTTAANELRFIIMDTASNPAQAVQAVTELKAQGAACIIGPMVTARAAAQQANDSQIPMILLTQTPDIPETSPMVFRHFIHPEQQIRTSASYIMAQYNCRDFAVLYPDDRYGNAFTNVFQRLMPELGGHITDIVQYMPGETDFSAQINSLIKGYKTKGKNGRFKNISRYKKKKRNKIYRARTDFQVLFIPDSPTAAAMIAPQLKYHGISNVILMGTNLWHSQRLLSAAPYLQNAVFTNAFYKGKRKTSAFIKAFSSATGNSPGYIEAVTYDAVSSIAPLVETGNFFSTQTLAEQINRLDIRSTLTCPIGFDHRGESHAFLDIFQIKEEGIYLVRPCMQAQLNAM